MPSGLIALLDDVSMIAKLAAASADDIAGATAKAGTKAAGVVIDDTAVTPRYVTGLTPERELPIIWKIARGSLKNKLLFLLPGAVALSAFAPFLITPILMIGGAYLAFEATEKILEALLHDHAHKAKLLQADTPQELEDLQVAGAIRTDLILSAEIMAIALNELSEMHIAEQAAALAMVGIAITVAVYGVVGLIVKLDDIGLHLAERRSRGWKAIGMGLVHVVPTLLSSLSKIGTAAMLWVGGGILLHGMEELGAPRIPQFFHDIAHKVYELVGGGAVGATLEWITNAIGAAIAGAAIGVVIAMIVRRFHKHPEELIVD
jgi:predicted DNA repair protein MutK